MSNRSLIPGKLLVREQPTYLANGLAGMTKDFSARDQSAEIQFCLQSHFTE